MAKDKGGNVHLYSQHLAGGLKKEEFKFETRLCFIKSFRLTGLQNKPLKKKFKIKNKRD